MVSLLSLWLPILVSAVFVFVVSSIIHMLLKYHNSDWKKLPDQDNIMEDLRKYNIPPGDYFMPFCNGMEETKTPEAQERFNKGPVGVMTIMETGMPKMGGSLVKWFLFSIVVSLIAGYVASITIGTGAEYMTVHRVTSVVAFAGYALSGVSETIWYKRNCMTTVKNLIDGLIYGLVTGGVFGWLWPSM